MRMYHAKFCQAACLWSQRNSIEFSRQIDVKTSLGNLERFKYKSVAKSFIKALWGFYESFIKAVKKPYKSFTIKVL